MKKIIWIVLVMICLTGCTTRTVPLTPRFDYCGRTVVLTKDVRNGAASYSVDSVSSDDAKMFAYVSCSNLSGSHTLRWEWFSPGGDLYLSKNTDLSANYGAYSRKADAWHALIIKGDKAEQLSGRWKVKVYIDDRLISSPSFYLTKVNYRQHDTTMEESQKEKTVPVTKPFSRKYEPKE